MWAQLSTVRVQAGKADAVGKAMEQLRAFEQPDSGLLRTIVMQDQKDPERMLVLVVFESEGGDQDEHPRRWGQPMRVKGPPSRSRARSDQAIAGFRPLRVPVEVKAL